MNIKLKNTLAIIIIIMSLIFVNMPISFATITATVNGNSVRVRSKATTESEIVEIAYKGEKVEITGKEGEWYKVVYNRKEGYIRGDLLDIEDDSQIPDENTNASGNTQVPDENGNSDNNATEQPNQSDNQGNNNITNENIDNNQTNETGISTIKLGQNVLNEGDKITISNEVRLKLVPSINSNNITTVSANTEVMVTEIINSWCKIETEEQAGWLRIEK